MVFTTRTVVSGPTCGSSFGSGMYSNSYCRPSYGWSRPSVSYGPSYGGSFFGSRPYYGGGYSSYGYGTSPSFWGSRPVSYSGCDPLADALVAGTVVFGISALARAFLR